MNIMQNHIEKVWLLSKTATFNSILDMVLRKNRKNSFLKDEKLKMMLVFEDCYPLFGFSVGLLQDGFEGVMISCGADRAGVGKGSVTGLMEGTEEEIKHCNITQHPV